GLAPATHDRSTARVQHRGVRRDEPDIGDVAHQTSALQVRPEKRIVEARDLFTSMEACAVERNEIRLLRERRRECLAAACIPALHGRVVQCANLLRIAGTWLDAMDSHRLHLLLCDTDGYIKPQPVAQPGLPNTPP